MGSLILSENNGKVLNFFYVFLFNSLKSLWMSAAHFVLLDGFSFSQFWQQPATVSCDCSESLIHPKSVFFTRNEPNHDSVWSDPRPHLFIRPRFKLSGLDCGQGRFHTCNFGLDQTEKSKGSDQMRKSLQPADLWGCSAHCKEHQTVKGKDRSIGHILTWWWQHFFSFLIHYMLCTNWLHFDPQFIML